jgi:hypothetical protein
VTALASASEVLVWATDPVGGPPGGDLDNAESLVRPSAYARDLLRQLAVRAGAVLGAGRPPFGDDGPIGLGALLLAAAVGAQADADAAQRLASNVPPLRLLPGSDDGDAADPGSLPLGWADAVVRHGVVGPFMELATPSIGRLANALLAASPLTAVLLRPPSTRGQDDGYEAWLGLVMELIGRPHGSAVLTTALAAPIRDAAVLGWRSTVLNRLAARDTPSALGVYLAARVRHGPEWDDLVSRAGKLAAGSKARVAILRFWAPLALLDREDPALLRAQPFLDGYRQALDLAASTIPAKAGAT